MPKSRLSDTIDDIKYTAREYSDAHRTLWKLEAIDRITVFGTYFITKFLIMAVLDIVLILLGFAFAYWFGDINGSTALGFLISAFIFLFIQILVFVFRDRIFADGIVRKMRDVLFDDPENQK